MESQGRRRSLGLCRKVISPLQPLEVGEMAKFPQGLLDGTVWLTEESLALMTCPLLGASLLLEMSVGAFALLCCFLGDVVSPLLVGCVSQPPLVGFLQKCLQKSSLVEYPHPQVDF